MFLSTDNSRQVFMNLNEHENVTLSCEADGNPAPIVSWYRKSKYSVFRWKCESHILIVAFLQTST
jgi:hypothetical protein